MRTATSGIQIQIVLKTEMKEMCLMVGSVNLGRHCHSFDMLDSTEIRSRVHTKPRGQTTTAKPKGSIKRKESLQKAWGELRVFQPPTETGEWVLLGSLLFCHLLRQLHSHPYRGPGYASVLTSYASLMSMLFRMSIRWYSLERVLWGFYLNSAFDLPPDLVSSWPTLEWNPLCMFWHWLSM